MRAYCLLSAYFPYQILYLGGIVGKAQHLAKPLMHSPSSPRMAEAVSVDAAKKEKRGGPLQINRALQRILNGEWKFAWLPVIKIQKKNINSIPKTR